MSAPLDAALAGWLSDRVGYEVTVAFHGPITGRVVTSTNPAS